MYSQSRSNLSVANKQYIDLIDTIKSNIKNVFDKYNSETLQLFYTSFIQSEK